MAGAAAGDDDSEDDPLPARAHRERGLHQLPLDRLGVVENQRDQEEDDAQEQERYLLKIGGAEPHEEQGDEGRRGQIAGAGHGGVDERTQVAEASHRDAERQRDRAGREEAHENAQAALGDVVEEPFLREEKPDGGQHLLG